MVTYAFQETRLSRAQSVLGDAFDYAVNVFGIPGNEFMQLFTAGRICRQMENGEPAYISGKSGIEIAAEIISQSDCLEIEVQPVNRYHQSADYWIGWALCYYQWHSGRSYGDICKALPYEKMKKLYGSLHEADIQKFVEVADAQMEKNSASTRLKTIRTTYGLSQSELASRSGVSLRSIQMYEQRNKDINKASATTLMNLSRTLGCRIEDLME